MSSTLNVPIHHARSLQSNLDAIRGETSALKACGLLTVSADDLLDGGGTVHQWIADLERALQAASDGLPTGLSDGMVALPQRDIGIMQHIVYGMSAVLVWTEELHRSGRVSTALCGEALSAWAAFESACGMGGRTSGALGRPVVTPVEMADAPTIVVSMPDVLEVSAA